MESNDLALYEAIKGVSDQVSDETAKKIDNAVYAIYDDKAKQSASKGDIMDLRIAIKEDLNSFKGAMTHDIHELRVSITEVIHKSEEKQSDRFRYVYEKMSDYHKTTLTWLVTTAIAIVGLVVGLIKLL